MLMVTIKIKLGAPMDATEPQGDIEGLDYLFMGNFVGRGRYSLETVCTLFALKLKYPDQIHILRGCHEDLRLNKALGKEVCNIRFCGRVSSTFWRRPE